MDTGIGITVDKTHYNVGIEYDSMQRAFTLIEESNTDTTLSAKNVSNILGSGYSYTMTFHPIPGYESEYDTLFLILSMPISEYHIITVPFGQSNITFKAIISSGKDSFHGNYGSTNLWRSLEITFNYLEPYRTQDSDYYVLDTRLFMLKYASSIGTEISFDIGSVDGNKLILNE